MSDGSKSIRWRVLSIVLALGALAILRGDHSHADNPAAAPDKPRSPQATVEQMQLPPGFHATLFASEPEIVQPIAFCFDDSGRTWVAENLSYPKWSTDGTGHDRITILEDTDGDGHADVRKVFSDQISNISGIELGFGGVWVCSTPNLVFIPDANHDDVPDGPPQVVLDGFSLKAIHNVFNGLVWGPDGWLYGCNGILSNSLVGTPGTPEASRVPLNCGIWRYHPTKKVFEAVAHGTTNPWGFDFDDYGAGFLTNCVIKHLFHVTPGAHFDRMFGQDMMPHSYQLIESCADHIHWGGGFWKTGIGGDAHDEAGGGHAHSGCAVYLGDTFPESYRNSVLMLNIHGARLNRDQLTRVGSTYTAKHSPDFVRVGDPWFRGVHVKLGPDGSVYFSDWTDTGECHNYEVADQTNGRIYRVQYGQPKPQKFQLASLSDEQLVERQLHRNDWQVRHARRLLQERAVAGRLSSDTATQLWTLATTHADVTRRLRAVWALHAIGQFSRDKFFALVDAPNTPPEVVSWAVQLAGEELIQQPAVVARLAELAARSDHPAVRLHLASIAQRLPLEQRFTVLLPLLSAPADDYLTRMIWYALEPVVAENSDRVDQLLQGAAQPVWQELMARRLALLESPTGLDRVIRWLGRTTTPAAQLAGLQGIHVAYNGIRELPMPASWLSKPDGKSTVAERLLTSPREEVRQAARAAALLFGDAQVRRQLLTTLESKSAAVPERLNALQLLLASNPEKLAPTLVPLLTEKPLRAAAIRGLAASDDPAIAAGIIKLYGQLQDEERTDAIQTLTARPTYALALLDAVEQGTVPKRDLSSLIVRQMHALKHSGLNERIKQVWGEIRPAAEHKQEQIAKFKSQLTDGALAKAHPARGRALFQKTCGACHRLFDAGGKIGPELTGSQRRNIDYLLDNIVDPNAVVPNDYRVTVLELHSGRVVQGIVIAENNLTLTVQTPNEQVAVPKSDIEQRSQSNVSMMPEGLFDRLTVEELRDLVSYLRGEQQVPLP